MNEGNFLLPTKWYGNLYLKNSTTKLCPSAMVLELIVLVTTRARTEIIYFNMITGDGMKLFGIFNVNYNNSNTHSWRSEQLKARSVARRMGKYLIT